MSKNKSAKVKRTSKIKDLLASRLSGLRGKLVLFIVVPVLITSIVAISAVAIYVPDTVNKIKKSEVVLQGSNVEQQLNNTVKDVESGIKDIILERDFVDALVNSNKDEISNRYAPIIANKIKNMQKLIPELIVITNSNPVKLSILEYSGDDSIGYQKVQDGIGEVFPSSLVADAVHLHSIGAADSNETALFIYDVDDSNKLTLKIAIPVKSLKETDTTEQLEEENEDEYDDEYEDEYEENDDEIASEVAGVIYLEYNLSSDINVDKIKADNDIEISMFVAGDDYKGKRVATTIIDNGNRAINQYDMKEEVWSKISDNQESVITDIKLFGKSYICNYIPLISDQNIIGVMEVAAKKVDLTQLYLITTLVVFAITLGTVLIILGIVNKTLLKPISSIVKAADTLSEGDVNVDLSIKETRDEIGQLTRAFLTMAENIKQQVDLLTKFSDGDLTIEVIPKSERDLLGNNLKQMVETNNIIFSEIISSAEQVASGAKQIADGSQALSQGTTEQASAIEELSESISKIAAQTRMNAENANESNKLVNEILKNAEQGNQQMEKMVHAVQEISKHQQKYQK